MFHLPGPRSTYVCRWMEAFQACRIALANFAQEIYPFLFFHAIRAFHVHRSLLSHNLLRIWGRENKKHIIKPSAPGCDWPGTRTASRQSYKPERYFASWSFARWAAQQLISQTMEYHRLNFCPSIWHSLAIGWWDGSNAAWNCFGKIVVVLEISSSSSCTWWNEHSSVSLKWIGQKRDSQKRYSPFLQQNWLEQCVFVWIRTDRWDNF